MKYLGITVFCLIVVVPASGCKWLPIFQDCDAALGYLWGAWAVVDDADIDIVFETLDLNRPQSIKTVSDAQIYLAHKSYDEGCRWETHSAAHLGFFLFIAGRHEEAQPYLLESINEIDWKEPLAALAIIEAKSGHTGISAEYRRRSESAPSMVPEGVFRSW